MKLKLPIIKDEMPEPKKLTMQEYADFVESNLTPGDKERDFKQHLETVVNVRFKLKDS